MKIRMPFLSKIYLESNGKPMQFIAKFTSIFMQILALNKLSFKIHTSLYYKGMMNESEECLIIKTTILCMFSWDFLDESD